MVRVRRADQLRKEEDGTVLMFDLVCGWVKLTHYLQMSLSDSWHDDIENMKVEERKNWKHVYRKRGNIIETSEDAPDILLRYRKLVEGFCV